MPELPEVETVMRGLTPILQGRRIVGVKLNRANLRFPFPTNFVQDLTGARVTSLSRRAKYILIHCDHGQTLLVHLGMTGRFSVKAPENPSPNLGAFYFDGPHADGKGPHDHVIFSLDNGVQLIYSDPRRFGMMDVFAEHAAESHERLAHIGVEPLGNQFHGAALAAQFKNRDVPLKSALLDQRVVAGLGNIYVNEALHRTRLSPLRRAKTLVKSSSFDPRLDDLARHIRDILQDAIRAGGSTLQDFADTDGKAGSYQQRFVVYDQEHAPCVTPSCRGTITRIVQSGRSTFYCPKCQK
jgi:formamidopyrimidine-DNA glycosylase